jgi:hypothetical protein
MKEVSRLLCAHVLNGEEVHYLCQVIRDCHNVLIGALRLECSLACREVDDEVDCDVFPLVRRDSV